MAQTLTEIPHLATKLRYATAISYSLFFAIIGLFTYWNLTRSSGFSITVWCIQALPLLALLPSMLKKAYRAYSWLCFILLFYFIFAVERSFLSTSTHSDFVFVGLVALLFIAAMMTSRWMQRQQKLEQASVQ